MSITIDTGILELMASKVCHDIISPIGAVNNGREFLTEMGANAGDEVIELIEFSASQASAKLKAYRMAYGAGGADDSIKPEEVHQAIEAIVGKENKITQNWDPHGELGYREDRPKAYCKILICSILLAIECLPKGGEIGVKPGTDRETLVIATGDGAAIRERTGEALSHDLPREALEPKYVHPYLTGLLAQAYDHGVSMQAPESDCVQISIKVPSAG